MTLIRYVICVFAVLLAGGSSTLLVAERAPAQAQGSATRQQIEDQFREWLASTVWPDAQKQGISRETFDRALSSLSLDWSLPELQPPGQTIPQDDQRQAEFQNPGLYFSEGQLTSLATAGVNLLKQWANALTMIELRYGVPREIIVAICVKRRRRWTLGQESARPWIGATKWKSSRVTIGADDDPVGAAKQQQKSCT